MDLLHRLATSEPLLALFVTIAMGYLVGRIKIGSFVLGGIAGTLLVGVVVGQLGVNIDSGIKGIFFALFIHAVGYQGGPQFFHALNRRKRTFGDGFEEEQAPFERVMGDGREVTEQDRVLYALCRPDRLLDLA